MDPDVESFCYLFSVVIATLEDVIAEENITWDEFFDQEGLPWGGWPVKLGSTYIYR